MIGILSLIRKGLRMSNSLAKITRNIAFLGLGIHLRMGLYPTKIIT